MPPLKVIQYIHKYIFLIIKNKFTLLINKEKGVSKENVIVNIKNYIFSILRHFNFNLNYFLDFIGSAAVNSTKCIPVPRFSYP